MKKRLLLACLLAASFSIAFSQAPAFAWAKTSASIGNPKVNNVGGVAVDTINNVVYATGSISGGGINFGNGDYQTNGGSNCVYLVKYNLSGTLIWSKAFDSNDDNTATGVGVDNSGNVYITGYSQADTVRFGAQFLVNVQNGSSDHTVGYVAKFDANGNAQWLRGNSGGGGVVCNAITVDAAGNSYITGHVVTGTGNFMGSALTQSGFYAKISSSGTLTWFQQSAPAGVLISQGTSIALDNSGNLVICGTFAANINFGSVNLAYTGSGGTYRRFVAKMNVATGTCAWAKADISPGIDYAYDVATDLQNNIFVTGFLQVPTPNGNVEKQFIEKFDPSGNSQWLNSYKNPFATPINCVTTDKQGNVYAAFNINDTTVYGNYTISPVSPLFNFSTIVIAIVKLNTSGTVLYAKASVGPVLSSYAQANNIAVDEGGDLFISGSVSKECKFDNIDLQPSGSNVEFLMAKLGNNVTGGGTTGIPVQSMNRNMMAYPNPASTVLYINSSSEKSTVKLSDLSGKIVLAATLSSSENQLDISTLSGGAYILEINTNGSSSHQKIIVNKN